MDRAERERDFVLSRWKSICSNTLKNNSDYYRLLTPLLCIILFKSLERQGGSPVEGRPKI